MFFIHLLRSLLRHYMGGLIEERNRKCHKFHRNGEDRDDDDRMKMIEGWDFFFSFLFLDGKLNPLLKAQAEPELDNSGSSRV